MFLTNEMREMEEKRELGEMVLTGMDPAKRDYSAAGFTGHFH